MNKKRIKCWWMKTFNTFCVAAIIVIGISSSAAANEKWRGYTYHPTTDVPEYLFLERIADQVKKDTNGYLSIKVSPAGSLPIKGNDVAQAVSDGIIPFAAATSGTVGMIPIYGLSRLPMLFNTDEDIVAGNDAILKKAIAQAMDKKNLKLLAIWWYPAHSIWTKDKISKLSDINGMKLRVTTPPQAKLIEQYGAIPVQIATAEVAPALQQGIVDGALTSVSGARLWIDNFKTNFLLPLNYGTSLVIANKQSFESLPKDVQDKLVKAAEDGARWVTTTLGATDTSLRQKFVDEKGLTVVLPTSNEVSDALGKSQQIWVEIARSVGPEGVEALAILKETLGK